MDNNSCQWTGHLQQAFATGPGIVVEQTLAIGHYTDSIHQFDSLKLFIGLLVADKTWRKQTKKKSTLDTSRLWRDRSRVRISAEQRETWDMKRKSLIVFGHGHDGEPFSWSINMTARRWYWTSWSQPKLIISMQGWQGLFITPSDRRFPVLGVNSDSSRRAKSAPLCLDLYNIGSWSYIPTNTTWNP
jgi:hypothetical protein